MIVVINEPATDKEINSMKEAFGDYIKVVVDIEKEALAGGGKLHADCEAVLIEQGGEQKNLWGGGVDPINKIIEYNSLTNIRPIDNNPSQEILDTVIRKRFEGIVRRLLL